MVNVKKYFRQTVSIERKGAEDSWGDADYSPAEKIKGRLEPKEGLVRTATGDQVDTESELLTSEVLKLGDKVEGSEIVRIEAVVDKAGKTIAYKYFL